MTIEPIEHPELRASKDLVPEAAARIKILLADRSKAWTAMRIADALGLGYCVALKAPRPDALDGVSFERVVDRALQSLRRRGEIRYLSPVQGWTLGGGPAR